MKEKHEKECVSVAYVLDRYEIRKFCLRFSVGEMGMLKKCCINRKNDQSLHSIVSVSVLAGLNLFFNIF